MVCGIIDSRRHQSPSVVRSRHKMNAVCCANGIIYFVGPHGSLVVGFPMFLSACRSVTDDLLFVLTEARQQMRREENVTHMSNKKLFFEVRTATQQTTATAFADNFKKIFFQMPRVHEDAPPQGDGSSDMHCKVDPPPAHQGSPAEVSQDRL